MLPRLMQQVSLGIIGGGTVGSGVFHAFQRNGELLSSRIGIGIQLRKIAVKACDEPRPYEIPRSLLTTDWTQVVQDPAIDVVAELAGGTTIARTMVLTALKLGKPVITANKALLSACGEELFAAAREHQTNLYYEASVAGGIPIIKALREGFVGNRITGLYGIVNGTCNYILTRMRREGAEFADVLADAQRLGYAEAEPSLDIDGHDSLHKIGILASLAHGFWVQPRQIHVEGIRSIARADIQFAGKLGHTIKLLGIIKKVNATGHAAANVPNGSCVQVSVYPALIPDSHVLASVNDVYNAVFVRGDVVGDTLFYGRGAGKDATASAVLSDLADAALDLKFGTKCRVPPFVPHEQAGSVMPIAEAVSRYYVRLSVADRPGVLAKIAAIFGENQISLSSVIQPEGHEGESVPLIFMTHEAPNAAMQNALHLIRHLDVNKAEPVMIRVETF
jgi:homoserine dehydrogenase